MASAARVVQAFLAASGQGVLQTPAPKGAWLVVTDKMPSDTTQDKIICVYNTGAETWGRGMRGEFVVYPLVQIRVRALTDVEAWSKSKSIYDLLCSVVPSGGSGVVVDKITARIDSFTPEYPMPMGQDIKNDRQNVSLNTRVNFYEV